MSILKFKVYPKFISYLIFPMKIYLSLIAWEYISFKMLSLHFS